MSDEKCRACDGEKVVPAPDLYGETVCKWCGGTGYEKDHATIKNRSELGLPFRPLTDARDRKGEF